MASKGLRTKWVPELAAAINYRPQRLRALLRRNGLKQPNRSEREAMEVLKANGFSLAKYKPSADAVGAVAVSAPKDASDVSSGNGTVAVARAAHERKQHGSWADKLIVTRLAKLLPEGPTPYGKMKVRALLKKHGHTQWKKMDEATALAVMQEEGISIDGFEYEATPRSPGSSLLVLPPATEHEALRQQYLELGERLKTAVAELAEREKKNNELCRILVTTKRGLVSYETKLLPMALTKFGGMQPPLNYPIDTLGFLRENADLFE